MHVRIHSLPERAISVTYRGRRDIRAGALTEPVPFEGQEPVHIPYVPQVFLPPRIRADRLLPGVDEFENTRHDGSRERGWSFGKATDEFIEEFFRANLQMKRISTRLNESVKEGEGQHGDMRISMIDEPDGQHPSFPRPG